MNSATLVILLVISTVGIVHGQGDVVVDKLKLFVDGTEFFIKAMCYNPVPLGIENMTSQGYEGGGLCSPKQTTQGDWKSACYDSDYFDGSAGTPSGSPSEWFKAVWERDFPLIQQLGANTLRLYNANPTTLQASQDTANDIPYPYGKNHIPFMDMAAQYGFKVIFPLFADYTYITNSDTATIEQYIMWQINEVGNHSALLMYTYGNELSLNGDTDLINSVNSYISFARSYMSTRWNRTVPITSAVVDLPASYDSLMELLDVDVFTTNAGYRGTSFSDLWSGNSVTSGMYNLSCQYNKPIFIGEIGWMSAGGAINAEIPNWFNQIWSDLVAHIDQGCVGGAFFEYSNEPFTKSDPLQQNMGVVHFNVSNNSDQQGVYKADSATPNDYIFDSVASGTYNNIEYNMNTDVFSLIGRQAYQLSDLTSSADICTASGEPSTTGSFIPVNPTITGSSTTGTHTVAPSSTTGNSEGSTTGSSEGSTSGSNTGNNEGSSTGSSNQGGSTTGSEDVDISSTTSAIDVHTNSGVSVKVSVALLVALVSLLVL